jgi:hypothetical protein
MAKTGPNFKLNKTTKRRLASIVNTEASNHWKRCMISAEHAASIMPRVSKPRKENAAE